MGDRLTMHKGYRNANGKPYNKKHIQREEFEKPLKDGVKPPDNIYWDFTGGKLDKPFSVNEDEFYYKHFSPHVDRHNRKCEDRRQYGRKITVASYREKHPPEETLLYLGTGNVDVDALAEVFQEFDLWQLSRFWDKDKGGVRMLNAALHLDETTPHIHFRQAYMYRDKDGDWQISQNKALELMRVERPDPTKPPGKYNNAKMTYTAMCREMFLEIAREHGIELVTKPLPKDEVGLPLKEYKEREAARAAAAAEQQAAKESIDALQRDIEVLQEQKESVADELTELQEDKKDAAETLERLRKTTVKEQKVREQLRKEATDEGYRDGFVIGVKDGAESPTGQLNEFLRKKGAGQDPDRLQLDVPLEK